MQEQLQKRLQELKADFKKGQVGAKHNNKQAEKDISIPIGAKK